VPAYICIDPAGGERDRGQVAAMHLNMSLGFAEAKGSR
jgi:hypothetical protein